ncbi:hypothetical protein BDV95DRAFT_572055 [Massariosphaeria phaeospora]|uniref:Uncharacterized protein n=1 Tax=Massariosphaeria phaeospora TaxID=100035 RepID=A0A7C8MA03_9PLEO|nr:hypothetical protein BDV95DRAFT_572055 [Massariosphaeria phaeospora]
MAAQYQSPNLYDQQQQQYGSQAQPGSEQYGNPSQPGNEQYENPSGAGAEQYGNPSAAGNAQYGDNQGYGENQGINEQAQPSQPDAHQGAGAQGQPPSEHSAIQKGTPAAPAYHGQFHPAYTKPHDDPHHKMILQGLHHKGGKRVF